MNILRRTAAVLLIIAITSFSCLMSVEAYRTKFIDMVIRMFNDLADYRFSLSESSTSNIASLPHPVLSNLPHSMYKTDDTTVITAMQLLAKVTMEIFSI